MVEILRSCIDLRNPGEGSKLRRKKATYSVRGYRPYKWRYSMASWIHASGAQGRDLGQRYRFLVIQMATEGMEMN